ncbi:extracellular solute-binding protein [Paenibacillus psychroresistens]|uniref:Extracellular solute-binding protein n=1 Tax=Paenibacillus psychroresistens TaxID=1778678 RepID=A0A6B8RGP1_9BACL|nr:extracellular solute-binding protein [Paenibacillus psychroresistens]QGQ94702.1 extracellular solute-binding protein [Paenibacillus psychroresistens]
MKKYSLLLVSILLIFVMTACSSNPSGGAVEQSNNGNTIDASPNSTKGPADTIANTNTPAAMEKPDGQKHTIVFSMFYEEDFINEAVKKYEAKHPNITIKLNIAHPKGDDANWEANHEKFIKTMNTQMLSGQGPDLLEMDQLPVDQYVNKKLLANMSEMMDSDPSFQRADYFTNILDNIKLNGGVYGMPVSFYLDAIIGDQAALEKAGIPFDDKSWTWNQFIQTVKELAQKAEREYAFTYSRPEYLLNEMVHANYATFVDQANLKGKFDSDAFTGLMNQIKTMYDEKVVSKEQFSDNYFAMDKISSIRNYLLDAKGFLTQQGNIIQTKLYDKPKAEGQEAGGYFQTVTTIGINAKSTNKPEAWDFVKYLISEEVESGGFSLNKKAYQKQVQQFLQAGVLKADEEGQLHGKEFKFTEADIQALEPYLSGAIHPVEVRPSKVEDIIIEEGKAFFVGEKSADAVAKLIQNRVSIYLNE